MSGDGLLRREVGGLLVGMTTALAGCLGEDDTVADESGAADDHESATASDDDEPQFELDGVVLSSAFPIELVEPDAEDFDGHATGDDLVTHLHGHDDHSHWHFAPLEVPVGDERRVRVRLLTNDDHSELPLGQDEQFQINVEVTDSTPLETTVDGAILTLDGTDTGEGYLTVQIRAEEDVVWEPPPLEVEVGNPDEETDRHRVRAPERTPPTRSTGNSRHIAIDLKRSLDGYPREQSASPGIL